MTNAFISYLQLFKNIPSNDVEFIVSHLQYKKVSEGEQLLNEGAIARELFFISKGILKIVVTNEKGKSVTHFFLKENQFCSILDSFNNNTPAKEGIQAACDAELIVLQKNALETMYKQISYFKELISGITQQALLDKIQIKNDLLGEDAATCYQKFLLRQPDIALRVPLGDIASYLGITQQSLSRIRRNTK